MIFNNGLALILIVLIPFMWFMQGYGVIRLSPEIIGALIVTWTLVIQYYFRKVPPK